MATLTPQSPTANGGGLPIPNGGAPSPPPTPALSTDVTNMGVCIDGITSTPSPFFPRPPESPVSSANSSPIPRSAATFHTTADEGSSSSGGDHAKTHEIPAYGVHEQDAGGPQSRPAAQIHTYQDDEERQAFPRLSRPVELLRSEYDVVVIGSGYGGGVAASNMARTGQTVCLLERGREKWPGEYPIKAKDSLREMHYSGTLAPGSTKGLQVDGGDPTGMFHLVFGRGQNAVVCNGLGGTSLMNANVFMEVDKRTLAMKQWPPEIRDNVEEMRKYYKKAETVLEPEAYPDDWPVLPKMEMLKKQAGLIGLGDKWGKVRQTTRFRRGPNHCGVEMKASALTGQDCTGVNDGSKTTTLVTYIADAWNWGADIFCECEVRYVEKCADGDGYLIYFAWHGRNRGKFSANLHDDLMWVKAKKAVFLGAGAIASTEILLRSKAMGLEMSTQVGQNMSGNGDILAFGYNTDDNVNGVGRAVPSPYNPIGPTITSVIDCRDSVDNPLDGFVIEEGAVPAALAHFLQAMLDNMPGSVGPDETLLQRTRATLARFGSRFLGPYFKKGAIEKTQIYLIMSHDSNQAVLSLKDDKPVLEFLGVARSGHVKELNALLEKATKAVGGTLVQNPFFALMGQQVTVHPIGGACMARDNTGATGVVNHVGAVFTGNGPETHRGLIVTDGSVIPTALGANPFATITALAERSVEAYAARENLVINTERNRILDLFGKPQHPPRRSSEDQLVRPFANEESETLAVASDVIRAAEGVHASGMGFTEVMSGFVHHDPHLKEDRRETYELAYRRAKALCESARFFLTVQSFNTRELTDSAQHRGLLTGTFACPSIPGSPFMVQRGEFNLFMLDLKAPGTRNLTYDFDMRGVDGRLLHFHGYKVVDSSVALSPVQFWRSTSTLYVSISEHVAGMCADLDDEDAWRRGKVVAKGIMNIQASDFLSEVLTMAPTGSSLLKKAMSAASFLTFFTRKSLSLFFTPLTPLEYPSQTYDGYINDTPPDHSVNIIADDGVSTRMHIWEPTHCPDNNEASIRNVFMIPGAAVDHQIFALPTIPYNTVNYFTRAGYRVFVTVHRIGQLMVAENMWTTFDARLDLKACYEWIRKEHGTDKIYTIAHCMGSVALSTGMLDGTIPASWIKGVTCSQVFMNPVWSPTNMAKVAAGPIPMDKLYTLLAGTWFNCTTSPDDSLIQRIINQALRLYPQSRKEFCSNAACHRCSLVFGRCWCHVNLNEATHRQIDRFFGGVNMRLLNLLMKQGSEGHAMANGPAYTRLDTPENIERLRGISFLLFVGRENAVLSTEATERTYELLTDAFGTDGADGAEYRRRVVPGYGHLDPWMGRNAWKDIYPFIREEVDRVTRGEAYKFVEPDDKYKRMVEEGMLLA
ncbi:hypothetical protein B0H67DRAFT_599992 [Lasiosphaeris hirsuta]|uniref:Cholesterol oxidase n=1 Tax=Lasiosphaeris hirsuta TaxID=260670 RepID=A0AA40AR91_9PEZI|nr:hypothetical protein B0H67DRAFT_599992 [Lasiosphaeris hirsuta]